MLKRTVIKLLMLSYQNTLTIFFKFSSLKLILFTFQAFGDDVTDWANENIADLGTIIAGLSDLELGDLTVDIDVLEALGQYQDVFTESQVSTLCLSSPNK